MPGFPVSFFFFYKQYIDYLLFVWKGSLKDSHAFVEYLNENDLGLSFTLNQFTEKTEFLDLELIMTVELPQEPFP